MRLLIPVIVLVIALAPACGFSADKGKVEGEITELVDSGFVVQPQARKDAEAGDPVTVRVEEGTSITVNKESAEVGELAVGDKVKVKGKSDADGVLVARKVAATRPEEDAEDESEDGDDEEDCSEDENYVEGEEGY
ncbi:MAG: DUF5666 domain-containing protein [Planctomycetota bacterium]